MTAIVDDHWDEESLRQLPVRRRFRLRGTDMTRLETFTDAAFRLRGDPAGDIGRNRFRRATASFWTRCAASPPFWQASLR